MDSIIQAWKELAILVLFISVAWYLTVPYYKKKHPDKVGFWVGLWNRLVKCFGR